MVVDVTAFAKILPAIIAPATISFEVTALAWIFGVLIEPLAIAVSVIWLGATIIWPPLIVKRLVEAGKYRVRSKVPAALPIDSVFCGVAPTSLLVRVFTSNETSLAVTVVTEDGFGILTAIGEGVAATDDNSVAPLYTRNSTPPHVTSDGAVKVAVMRCCVVPSDADTLAAANDAPVTWEVYSVPAAPDAGGDTEIVATGVPTAGARPSVFAFALLSSETA